MWALTPEKVRCRAQGGELRNISYRCLTDGSGGWRKGRWWGEIGKAMGFEGRGANMPQPLRLLEEVIKKKKKSHLLKSETLSSSLFFNKYARLTSFKALISPLCAIKGTISQSLQDLRLCMIAARNFASAFFFVKP